MSSKCMERSQQINHVYIYPDKFKYELTTKDYFQPIFYINGTRWVFRLMKASPSPFWLIIPFEVQLPSPHQT